MDVVIKSEIVSKAFDTCIDGAETDCEDVAGFVYFAKGYEIVSSESEIFSLSCDPISIAFESLAVLTIESSEGVNIFFRGFNAGISKIPLSENRAGSFLLVFKFSRLRSSAWDFVGC